MQIEMDFFLVTREGEIADNQQNIGDLLFEYLCVEHDLWNYARRLASNDTEHTQEYMLYGVYDTDLHNLSLKWESETGSQEGEFETFQISPSRQVTVYPFTQPHSAGFAVDLENWYRLDSMHRAGPETIYR